MFCILYVQFTTWFFSFSHRSVTTKTIARRSSPWYTINNMFCIGCTLLWIVFGFLLSASKEKGCYVCYSLVLVPWLLYNVYVPYDNKALQKSLSGKKFNASQILFAYDFSQDVDKFIALYCFNAWSVLRAFCAKRKPTLDKSFNPLATGGRSIAVLIWDPESFGCRGLTTDGAALGI